MSKIHNIVVPYQKAEIPEAFVIYTAEFQGKGLFCNIVINNFNVINNLGSSEGFFQGSFSFNDFIQNGENSIAIEVDSWHWADESKQHLSFEEKQKITTKDAFCRLAIVAEAIENGKKQKNTVAVLRLEVNSEHQLIIADETYLHNYPTSLNNSVNFSLSNKQHRLTPNLHCLSRTLNAKYVANWSWVSAPRYDEIPNNRQLLENAYFELWQIFNEKNLPKLRELLDISLYEITLGILFDASKVDHFIEDNFNAYGYPKTIHSINKMIPFDPKKFNVIQLAQGKIVHLEYKNEDSLPYSPIIYEVQGDLKVSKHYFSFIGGKFRIVR